MRRGVASTNLYSKRLRKMVSKIPFDWKRDRRLCELEDYIQQLQDRMNQMNEQANFWLEGTGYTISDLRQDLLPAEFESSDKTKIAYSYAVTRYNILKEEYDEQVRLYHIRKKTLSYRASQGA